MKQTTDDSNEEECGNRGDRARRDVEALKDSLLLPSAISYGHVVVFFPFISSEFVLGGQRGPS